MRILSRASSKQCCLTAFRSRRAARSAASLTRLARSAPTIPGVARAMVIRSTSLARGTPRVWILRIARRPFQSGRSTTTRRSKRPGRKSALSSPSGRLVAAMTTDGIDFVDEDDAGGCFLGLVEEVTHATGPDPDQHLDKLRAAHREEGHFRLTGHGPCQQGLPGSRRPDKQHATGDLSPQPLELARGLEKLHHLY